MNPTAIDLVNLLIQEQQNQQVWARKHFQTIEDGHFIAIAVGNGECVLAPYPEFSAILYRGQPSYWDPARPSV